MTIAVDLGTTGIRCLWQQGAELRGKQFSTLYAMLPEEQVTIKLLDKSHAKYAICEGQVITWGEAGLEVAHQLGYQAQFVLPEGKLPYTNPVARQLISVFVDAVVPVASKAGRLCTLTGISRLQGKNVGREQSFISQLLQIKGYELEIISPGLALGLAELGDHSLTGATLSLGTTHAVFSLMLHGRELITIHLKRGANWIDEQIAMATDSYRWNTQGARHLDIVSMKNWREDYGRSLLQANNEREQHLIDRYRDYLRTIVNRLTEDLKGQRIDPRVQRESIPLVISGGVANIKGFLPLLENLLTKQRLPIRFEQFRLVSYNPWTLARGCLIHAELNSAVSNMGQSHAA
jgi:hypothetical protein